MHTKVYISYRDPREACDRFTPVGPLELFASVPGNKTTCTGAKTASKRRNADSVFSALEIYRLAYLERDSGLPGSTEHGLLVWQEARYSQIPGMLWLVEDSAQHPRKVRYVGCRQTAATTTCRTWCVFLLVLLVTITPPGETLDRMTSDQGATMAISSTLAARSATYCTPCYWMGTETQDAL